MTSINNIKATFAVNTQQTEDEYFESLMQEAALAEQELMTEEGQKPWQFTPSDLPPIDRYVTIRHQKRQHKLKLTRMKIEEMLETLDSRDVTLHAAMEEGSVSARGAWRIHLKKKQAAREQKSKLWNIAQTSDMDYMKEGLSEGQYRRCLGWLFGNLENMAGVQMKLNNKGQNRVDMSTVTMEHLEEIENHLLEEIEWDKAHEHKSGPGDDDFSVNEDGDDAVDDFMVKNVTQAELHESPRIGDNLNPDVMDELQDEVIMTAEARERGKMSIRKAQKTA